MSDKKSFILSVLFGCLIAYFFIGICGVRLQVVQGGSMEPTLHSGDVVLSYRCKTLNRGDIISIYSSTLGKYIIKRVVAIDGDSVYSNASIVTVNGVIVASESNEVYIAEPQTTVIEINNVFLLGDNFLHSYDSRYFGQIPINTKCYKIIQGFKLRSWMLHVILILLLLCPSYIAVKVYLRRK